MKPYNEEMAGVARQQGGAAAGGRAGLRGIFGMSLALLLLLTSACNFDVTDPTRLTDDDIQGDAVLSALTVGAITSYDGAFDRLSMITALLSDEAVASGSWNGWHQADKQGIFNLFDSESDHINIPWITWRWLARARAVADETYELIKEQVPEYSSDPRAALMRLYSGLAVTDFAENFCQAAYDGGPVVERPESYAMARDRLQEAIQIAQAAGVDSIVHRAQLVLARVHMGLGDRGAALTAARAVPKGLNWIAHFRDASGERNFFWGQNADRGELSIAPRFRNTDPRTPAEDQNRTGPDGVTPVWAQLKYPTRNHDWIIGNWKEARLIEAEILLDNDDVAGAVALMNEVRADSELAAFPLDLTKEEAWEHLRDERAFELFLQARRYNDMQRWSEFPANWGASCIPISREEKDSNPNLRDIQLAGWP